LTRGAVRLSIELMIKLLARVLLLLLFASLAGVIIILGYLGFLGKFSKKFGVGEPLNLGVEYNALDLSIALKKVGVQVGQLSLGDAMLIDIKYSGQHPLEDTFSAAELTALANNSPWKYYPLSQIQIWLNFDNTVEISGFLIGDRLADYLKITGEIDGTVTKALVWLSLCKKNIPFYLKGQVSVENERVDLDLQKVILGNLAIPQKLIVENEWDIKSFIEKRIRFVNGLSIQSLLVNEGAVKFVGTLPDQEMVDGIVGRE